MAAQGTPGEPLRAKPLSEPIHPRAQGRQAKPGERGRATEKSIQVHDNLLSAQNGR